MGFGSKIGQLLAFLLMAGTAHATITVADRGTGTSNTSGTSLVITPNATMTAGNTAVVFIGMDNTGATPNISASSFTDSAGNKWYVYQDKASSTAGNNVEGAILASLLTANLGTGGNVTVTLTGAVTAKVWSIVEVTPTSGNIALPGSYLVQANSTASTAPLIASGGVTFLQASPSNGDCFIGMVAVESDDLFTVFDSDTTNGSWSTAQHIGVGSGVTGQSIATQWKVVSAYGTQSMGDTISTSRNWRGGFLILTDTDPKARAAGSGGASESTTSIPVSLPLAVGSVGVLGLAADNAGASGTTANLPSSITDSAGNTWTQRQTGIRSGGGVASDGIEVGLYTSVLTSALNPGATLPANYGVATTIKAWTMWEFAPVSAGTMSYVTGGMGTGVASTTPSFTTGSSIVNGDYIVGMMGAEGNNSFVGDATSTNGAWKPKAVSATGSALAGGCTISQYKKVTATATQTYSPTQSVANDTMMGWVELNEAATPTPTPTPAGGFLQMWP